MNDEELKEKIEEFAYHKKRIAELDDEIYKETSLQVSFCGVDKDIQIFRGLPVVIKALGVNAKKVKTAILNNPDSRFSFKDTFIYEGVKFFEIYKDRR